MARRERCGGAGVVKLAAEPAITLLRGSDAAVVEWIAAATARGAAAERPLRVAGRDDEGLVAGAVASDHIVIVVIAAIGKVVVIILLVVVINGVALWD